MEEVLNRRAVAAASGQEESAEEVPISSRRRRATRTESGPFEHVPSAATEEVKSRRERVPKISQKTAEPAKPPKEDEVGTSEEGPQVGLSPEAIEYEPVLQMIPPWVAEWRDLRLLSSGANMGCCGASGLSATQETLMGIQEDCMRAQQLLLAVQCGRDGGFFGRSAYELEFPEATLKEPFWNHPDTSRRSAEELCNMLSEKENILSTLPPYGATEIAGADGVHTYRLPAGLQYILKANIQRGIMRDLFSTFPKLNDRETHAETITSEVRSAPTGVHVDFVMGNDDNRIDMSILKAAGPQVTRRASTSFSRIITIKVNFARFRDHPLFNKETTAASGLLDSYERFQLVQSNLMVGMRSRKFYESQLRSLTQAGKNHGGDVESPAVQQIRDLYAEAARIESTCLLEMMQLWREVCAAREEATNAAAAAAASGTTEWPPGVPHPDYLTRFRFFLRRHGDVEETIPTPGDDVLNYVPAIADIDTAAVVQERFRIQVHMRFAGSVEDQTVGETELRGLDSTFSLRFNESFEIHTNRDPSEIELRLLDSNALIIATVLVPSSLTQAAHLVPFVLDQPSFESPSGPRQINGIISVATNWATSTGMTIENIKRLFLEGEADPLDPKNEPFVEVLRKFFGESRPPAHRKTGKETTTEGAASQPSGAIVPTLPEVQDLRLQTLCRRWRLIIGSEVPTGRDEVELVKQSIPPDAAATKRFLREIALAAEEKEGASKNLTAWQTKIRQMKMTQRAPKVDDNKKLAQIVTLPPAPTIKRLVAAIVSFFTPRSKLNPTREERPEADEIDRAKLAREKGASKILVHIMKGTDLPTRDDRSDLHPYAEVAFVGETGRTGPADGRDASWFETVSVDFCPIDFEESTLSLIADDIYVSIYDEVSIAMPNAPTGAEARAHVTHFRTERRLIGSVKLPFYTLFQSPRGCVEGQFAVNMPRWIAGYTKSEMPAILSLYFSLDPPLRKEEEKKLTPMEVMQEIAVLPVSDDLHILHQYALQWRARCEERAKAIKEQNPLAGDREFTAFVTNSNGDPTLICRYVNPKGISRPSNVETIFDAIRLVSLIPFVVDMIAWNDRKDVWSTVVEYLEMGAGDYEEMALLLLNMIRGIEPDAFVALAIGTGDIYSQAMYVLYEKSSVEGAVRYLIDPRTGALHPVDEPLTGFSEVSMIVSHDQVWGNVQLSGVPYRMVWDVKDDRYWAPMFPQNVERFIKSIPYVNPHRVKYALPKEEKCLEMEDTIKRKMKKKLKEWRNDRPPMYRDHIGTVLREQLVLLEQERRQHANLSQSSVSEAHLRAISEFSHEYVAVGMPVNTPYQGEDFENLFELVRETCVHEIGTDGVTYAIGVYVKPYLETVRSVWIYVLGLLPRAHESRRHGR